VLCNACGSQRIPGHLCLQDAKGKIRVYCRVRPVLEFEAAKRQVSHGCPSAEESIS